MPSSAELANRRTPRIEGSYSDQQGRQRARGYQAATQAEPETEHGQTRTLEHDAADEPARLRAEREPDAELLPPGSDGMPDGASEREPGKDPRRRRVCGKGVRRKPLTIGRVADQDSPSTIRSKSGRSGSRRCATARISGMTTIGSVFVVLTMIAVKCVAVARSGW